MYKLILPYPPGQISDGYHTFDELYDHRMLLFIALMNAHKDISWKSKKHADGSMFDGDWFVAGMDLPTGQITYHLKSEYWNLASVKDLPHAPEWDGHTSIDALNRLKNWLIYHRGETIK